MALVVLLRGVNVGGHRSVRPSLVARQLRRLDVVNVGAAGTFVVQRPISQRPLRAELSHLLPFETEVMICTGSDILRLVATNPLTGLPSGPNIVWFVSVLAKRAVPAAPLPQCFPPAADWSLKIVGQQGRFVYGVYKREMRAIRHLSNIDRLFGVPATTRSWTTIVAVARLLEAGST